MALAGNGSPAAHTAPSANVSFFQIGTVCLSVSMSQRQASKASARWAEATTISTLVSPIFEIGRGGESWLHGGPRSDGVPARPARASGVAPSPRKPRNRDRACFARGSCCGRCRRRPQRRHLRALGVVNMLLRVDPLPHQCHNCGRRGRFFLLHGSIGRYPPETGGRRPTSSPSCRTQLAVANSAFTPTAMPRRSRMPPRSCAE